GPGAGRPTGRTVGDAVHARVGGGCAQPRPWSSTMRGIVSRRPVPRRSSASDGRMKTLWGSDDRGPGGDPSWLGGKARGAGSQGSGGWSSDFDDGAQRPDPDFGGGDVGGGDGGAGGFGGRDAQAESMAPGFGGVTGGRARTTEAAAHWSG